MLLCSNAYAIDNDIYITQSGSNLDLDVTQDGQNNTVGNSTTSSSVAGATTNLAITQVGNSNVLTFDVNGATYTGTFTKIRELFANLPESKSRGYKPGRFSFNVKGGRCENCSGDGVINIEMQFLPDVSISCDSCKGKRYNREALEIKVRGKNISDILSMSVEQASEFFSNIPSIKNKLETLKNVGLGYIKLGQPSTQLSGGEAQRIKLSSELSKRSTGKTLYILDEPTTGLSFQDCNMLISVLQKLVESGNTVLIICLLYTSDAADE